MAFVPSSTIWLCAVPFDNSYKNQIYFDTPQKQATYFSTHTKKTFSEYYVVRKTTPEGKLINSIKVGANIDTLYGCNYMYYRNANHGTRLFFCFITDLIYINEGTTEIVYETDVYQTWRFDVDVLPSFVVREHSVTDVAGDNIIQEPLDYGEYLYKEVTPFSDDNNIYLTQWGYLVGTSVFVSETDTISPSRGALHSGIYQGVYFYYFEDAGKLNYFLDLVEKEKEDSILFISVLPRFSVGESVEQIFTPAAPYNGYVNRTTMAESAMMTVTDVPSKFGSFTPKNKKLFTSQFFRILVTNHSGSEKEYNIEDFLGHSISFYINGDVCASPSITLYPFNYKGIAFNVDEGLSITSFPQCAFHSDSFKLWLAKNQYTERLSTVAGVGSIIGGGALLLTGGGATMGVGMIAGGAFKIANVLNNQYKASREGNRAHIDTPKNNLLTAMSQNRFTFYIKYIKEEFAKAVDDYFTMFGYQTNEVKVPNVSSRPYFNYVQTIDVNIADTDFGIPNNDMQRLKKMYDDGVTLWKPTATVGDYSVDNSPN